MVLSSDTDAPQTKLSHTADSTYKGLKLTMLAYFILVKFIYSQKATKFCEISTLLLTYVVPVKSKVEISQNFVAFSEYMNFTKPET